MTNDINHDDDTQLVHVTTSAAGAIVRSEVESQIDAAHKYRRSVTRFLDEAKSLATINEETAASCIYSLPRGGKQITGPSIRMAEICASAYGNLQVGARVLDAEEREIAAQGAAWDMEKNLRCTIEVRRRITRRDGSRYDDDMITITGNAAASIALRNAIFRVIPRAYIDQIYNEAVKTAVGDAKSLAARRLRVLELFEKLGVSRERVFAKLEIKGVDDIDLEKLEVLIGLGTAIKDGSQNLDVVFPEPRPEPPAAEAEGKRMSLTKEKKAAPKDPEREAIEAEGQGDE